MNINDEDSGIYNDDDVKINPALIPKPSLCVSCKKDDLEDEEKILCLLNRHDQMGNKKFKCFEYESKYSNKGECKNGEILFILSLLLTLTIPVLGQNKTETTGLNLRSTTHKNTSPSHYRCDYTYS